MSGPMVGSGRYPARGARSLKFLKRTVLQATTQAELLAHVGTRPRQSCHGQNATLHAIFELPKVVPVMPLMIESIHEGVNEAQSVVRCDSTPVRRGHQDWHGDE